MIQVKSYLNEEKLIYYAVGHRAKALVAWTVLIKENIQCLR